MTNLVDKIVLKDVSKKYDNETYAVNQFNINIKEKEFIVLVGPSGCGKSTTLRMIAGLEEISEGQLFLNGEINNDVSPRHRNLAMVFQNYALYPHMTVENNLKFGLKNRGIDSQIIHDKIQEVSNILGLNHYLDRRPSQLSGGQRQRVALGRAMVKDSDIFLMDEPLSNLDAQLRIQMRKEIIQLHQRLNATSVYVTHDQTEAMTMADRIVVMNKGIINQIGSPREVYDNPNNIFVATFIGSPKINLLRAQIASNGLQIGQQTLQIEPEIIQALQLMNLSEVIIGIRSENFVLGTEAADAFTSEIYYSELLGSDILYYCQLNEQEILIKLSSDELYPIHSKVHFEIRLDKLLLFHPETEERIRL